MPEYAVFDKDTIKFEIMPFLSIAKKSFFSKFDTVDFVNANLYKLKCGYQCRLLSIGHLFIGKFPSWKTIFHHYLKWCEKVEWKNIDSRIVKKNKKDIDFLDYYIKVAHPPVNRRGGNADYQGRKKHNTANRLFLCNNQRVPLSCPSLNLATT